MRIKAKSVTLGLLTSNVGSSFIADRSQRAAPGPAAAAGAAAAAPFRLVSVQGTANGGSVPAVVAVRSAPQPSAAAATPSRQASSLLQQAQQQAAAVRPQQTAAPPEQQQQQQQPTARAPVWPPAQQQQQQRVPPVQQRAPLPPLPPALQPQPAPAAASGRPVRKRKVTSFAEDMLPTEVVLRRGGKARLVGPLAGGLPPAPSPPARVPQPQPTLPPGVARTAAGGAAAAATAGLPAGMQFVSMATAGGGRVTGLAMPAAALLAMPPALQQQLLRAQAAAAAAMAAPVVRGLMPYRTVAPGDAAGPVAKVAAPAAPAAVPLASSGNAGTSAGGKDAAQHAPVAVVQVAGLRDIMQLARQLEEEERKAALAASDARVALRALPGSQAAGRGGGGGGWGIPPKPPIAGARVVGGRGGGGGRNRGGGAGRYSRRPTPELSERRTDSLPPGTWHPGFQSYEGITYVSPLQAAAAPPAPVVVAGSPPRLSEAMVLIARPEPSRRSEDPLQSSLDFLHYAARTAGRPPPNYTGAVAAAVSAEQAVYKERLVRAHFARDNRQVDVPQQQQQKPAAVVEGTRKSMRTRTAPNIFLPDALLAVEQAQVAKQAQQAQQVPAQQPQKEQQRAKQQQQQQQKGAKQARESPPPEDDTDMRRGAEYQVVLPAVRPRPAAPSAEEARWVSGLACQPGVAPAPQRSAQQTAAMPASSVEERASWVAAAHDGLCSALGDERAAAMGLLAMGAGAHGGLLTAEEEEALDGGMRELGRAFHTIQLERVPSRSVYDLQNYYYNVWKLQATPRSRAWYEERVAEEARRQAELEAAEAAVLADQEAQRQRQESRYKRRMLREALQWIKAAARAPSEVHNRPTVVARAQRAAKLIGSLNAQNSCA